MRKGERRWEDRGEGGLGGGDTEAVEPSPVFLPPRPPPRSSSGWKLTLQAEQRTLVRSSSSCSDYGGSDTRPTAARGLESVRSDPEESRQVSAEAPSFCPPLVASRCSDASGFLPLQFSS